jgi:hypothetical protein
MLWRSSFRRRVRIPPTNCATVFCWLRLHLRPTGLVTSTGLQQRKEAEKAEITNLRLFCVLALHRWEPAATGGSATNPFPKKSGFRSTPSPKKRSPLPPVFPHPFSSSRKGHGAVLYLFPLCGEPVVKSLANWPSRFGEDKERRFVEDTRERAHRPCRVSGNRAMSGVATTAETPKIPLQILTNTHTLGFPSVGKGVGIPSFVKDVLKWVRI